VDAANLSISLPQASKPLAYHELGLSAAIALVLRDPDDSLLSAINEAVQVVDSLLALFGLDMVGSRQWPALRRSAGPERPSLEGEDDLMVSTCGSESSYRGLPAQKLFILDPIHPACVRDD